jgi:Flp pilus assembly protein TadB
MPKRDGSKERMKKDSSVTLIDLCIIAGIILVPSWSVAAYTDKVIYVIPMLAVTTFIVAQVMQHRNNRRLDKDEFKKEEDADTGIIIKEDSSIHE